MKTNDKQIRPHTQQSPVPSKQGCVTYVEFGSILKGFCPCRRVVDGEPSLVTKGFVRPRQ